MELGNAAIGQGPAIAINVGLNSLTKEGRSLS
jgi:hypothetical protein